MKGVMEEKRSMEESRSIEEKRSKEQLGEQQHFEKCRRLIGRNIDRYEAEYNSRKEETAELFKAVQAGDVELYNQLMTSTSLKEHAENQLRKNRAAYDRPYFGRIDYRDIKLEKNERIYIGKNGVFRNKIDVVIADWRAPISSVYYENELGHGFYNLPGDGDDDEKVEVDLKLKRTYDIDKGKLLGYYDSDVATNDQLLVQYLSKNKDVVLGEIIATIQKEQNEIIRESPFANIIVQGVAGSGKTTVAMHRISYILYNYKERFESNEFCIIGSNDLLLNYITSGLPELDVSNVKHMRLDQLFTHLLGKEWKKKQVIAEPSEDASIRCATSFILELELFLMYLREEFVDCREVKDPEIGRILSASGNERLLRENPQLSVNKLLELLDERMRSRIKFLMDGREPEDKKAKLAQYRAYYKNKRPAESIFSMYERFLTDYCIKNRIDMKDHLDAIHRGCYDIYDAAALCLIRYRVTQMEEDMEFGLMFIDEAQDFGISLYYVLKKILPKCYFTIMGDVSQNINYTTGMNDWDELTRLFLTGNKDKFRLLSKSYRNTIEISRYAGRILEKASSGRYKIDPVIRHGIPVEEAEFWSEDQLLEHTLEILTSNQSEGYHTMAIVCRDDKEAQKVRSMLDGYVKTADGEANNFAEGIMVLPVRMTKGLEFDTVILWNPNMKAALSRPDSAKLMYVAATRALHELHVLTC